MDLFPKKEFSDAVSKFSKENSQEFIDETFKICDKNKDNTISKEEFVDFVKNDDGRFKKNLWNSRSRSY